MNTTCFICDKPVEDLDGFNSDCGTVCSKRCLSFADDPFISTIVGELRKQIYKLQWSDNDKIKKTL
ncbi:hypothetical protein KAR91_56610 [Candidatus Pacearchaeota archaeon]|nr:hypothetical protein [Candidatus Pacearchaeota archaeon]